MGKGRGKGADHASPQRKGRTKGRTLKHGRGQGSFTSASTRLPAIRGGTGGTGSTVSSSSGRVVTSWGTSSWRDDGGHAAMELEHATEHPFHGSGDAAGDINSADIFVTPDALYCRLIAAAKANDRKGIRGLLSLSLK